MSLLVASDSSVSNSESVKTVETFYSKHFKVNFAQPFCGISSASIIGPADSGLDPFLASNMAFSCLNDLFLQTSKAPSQLTPPDSSTPSVDMSSLYTAEFLNIIGNPTHFAAHLRSTFLLAIFARNFSCIKDPKAVSEQLRQQFETACSSTLSSLLAHFKIICEHYNIAECGSFNLSALFHHFFNQVPFVNAKATVFNSIFSSTQSIMELSRFNSKEQTFLSTTLQAAFRASPMHHTVPCSLIFPLSISPDQADTFTQHYTQLLDTPTPLDDNDIRSNKVPISRIPFSVFAYLGLINSIMIDIWTKFARMIPSRTWFISPISANGFIIYNNLIQNYLSFPSLPDNLWCQIFSCISKLIPDNFSSVSVLFEKLNLLQIMNIKLQSIIRFPISIPTPSSSFTSYSSQPTLSIMLQTFSLIVTHFDFQLSRFYTNSNSEMQREEKF